MKHGTPTLVGALLIGVLLAPAAFAGPGHGKHGYKAKHHHRHVRDPLLPLAYDVEATARSVHRIAERTAHHGTYREGRALDRLHEMDVRARHFRRDLKKYGPDSRHVRQEFFELERAMERARYAVLRMHALPPVEHEFARLDRLMRDLDYAYGVRLASHRDHRRHDGRYRLGVAYRYDDEDEDRDGYVRIGTHWDGGRASVGFGWD